jgi:hypothetical protein
MKNRLGLTMILGVLGVSCALAACGDDDDAIDSKDDGGAGGEPSPTAGTKTGGSSSGGVAGKGGTTSGGKGGGGSGGSAGSAPLGGAGGEGGTVEAGGAAGAAGATNGGASGGADGGAGGAGGAAPLEYVCGTANIMQVLCSALQGAMCAEETNSCASCVPQRTTERSLFSTCPACLAENDRYYQCGIDAYESGNLGNADSGIECYEGYGAEISETNCLAILDSANNCHSVEAAPGGACPATWPP